MLIAVSTNNQIHPIFIDGDESGLTLGKKADLSEVIDDLLSIDWMRLDYLARNVTPEKESDDLTDEQKLFWGWRRYGLLWNYDDFCGYLAEMESLHKYNRADHINSVTFELLKEQFLNLFTDEFNGLDNREKQETYRFDNSILLLNMDDCLEQSNAEDCQTLLSTHFPKITLFSPGKASPRSTPGYRFKAFHSNCEMLVYNILRRMYPQADYYWLDDLLRDACPDLFDIFAPERSEDKTDAEKVRNFYAEFSEKMARRVKLIEERTKERGGSFHKGKQQNVSEEARPLLRLLSSRKFYTLLREEYEREKFDRTYGQRRLRSIDFLAADLESPFECYQYVESCYKKYAVQANNIYNVAQRESIAAFLCLYGRANADITFKRCRICGHYFVKSKEDKQQKECGRCRYTEETEETLKAFQEMKKKLLGSYYTAKSRLKEMLFGSKSDADQNLSEWLLGYNKEEIVSKYFTMMKQFKKMLDEVFQFITQVCVCREYDKFNQIYRSDYGIDLTERYEAEKSLITGRLKEVLKSGCSLQLLYDERTHLSDFRALYEAYLAPTQGGFFSYFRECAEAENEEQIDEANRRLRAGFAEVCAAFEAEHCDTAELRRLQQELLDVMVQQS